MGKPSVLKLRDSVPQRFLKYHKIDQSVLVRVSSICPSYSPWLAGNHTEWIEKIANYVGDGLC